MKKTLLPLAMLAGLAGSARLIGLNQLRGADEFFRMGTRKVVGTVARKKYRTNVGRGYYPAGSEGAKRLIEKAKIKRLFRQKKRLFDYQECLSNNSCLAGDGWGDR